MAAAPDTTKLTVPAKVSKALIKKLQSDNPNIHVALIRPFETVSELEVQTGVDLDLSRLFSLSEPTYDLICDSNPEVRFEKHGNHLYIETTSFISSSISTEITAQIWAWNNNANPPHSKVGQVECGHAEFILPGGNWRRADASWTRWNIWANAQPSTKRRLDIVPDLVFEIRSPGQSRIEQRRKMAHWILAGVEFGILIDPVGKSTYRYAAAGSGFLPGGTPNMGGIGFAGVEEERIIWPALPPPPPGLEQMGPALVVNIPAATLFPEEVAAAATAVATAAAAAAGLEEPPPEAAVAVGINHGVFVLSE